MGSLPRGFNGPPTLRRGLLRGIMPRGMNFRYFYRKKRIIYFRRCPIKVYQNYIFRGGPARGNPGRGGGRPMSYNFQSQT